VKPLQLIWTKFPHWNETNSVHVDDLSRNFALNTGRGGRREGGKGGKEGGKEGKKMGGQKEDREIDIRAINCGCSLNLSSAYIGTHSRLPPSLPPQAMA